MLKQLYELFLRFFFSFLKYNDDDDDNNNNNKIVYTRFQTSAAK